MIEIRVATPDGVRFISVAKSHGWRQLAPFSFDDETETLSRIHQLSDGTVLQLKMRDGDKAILVEVHGIDALSEPQHDEIQEMVARIFNFDWQLDDFYEYLQIKGIHRKAVQEKGGRLL
ncbi:MAG: hypothetical protein ACPG7F_08640, partial [Aggregatilineales bacterium]